MTIGLMGAMAEEIRLIVDRVALSRTEERLKRTFYLGSIAGHDVVVVHSGVGKVKAAARAQFLIERFGVDRVIFAGTAGALNPELRVGDIVVSSRALEWDFELLGGRPRWYEAAPDLVALAVEAGEKLGKTVRVGTVLTGDQPVLKLARKQQLRETFGGDCVEMEGGAVAHVCWMNGVPFVLVRVISDLADETMLQDFVGSFAEIAPVAAEVVVEMLHQFP